MSNPPGPHSQQRGPDTYFAAASRATPEELLDALHAAERSPLVAALTKAFGSVVAVLNEQRQILAVNDGLLQFLGVPDAEALLGLRPGEALDCVHHGDHPGGCGTSRFCSTCGAAIATVLALQEDGPVERECRLTTNGSRSLAVEFLVRATPLPLAGRRVVLLLLQDIRGEKRRQALERVFFHDLRNTLTGVMGCADLALETSPDRVEEVLEQMQQLSQRMLDEVESQSLLSQVDAGEYRTRPTTTRLSAVLQRLREQFGPHHPLSRDRTLNATCATPEIPVTVDQTLLQRVLGNMVTNALEATPSGGTVAVTVTSTPEGVTFQVSNPGHIPEDVALRIFQRYFSTKGESGRGLGTYSMKVLGESYLGGQLSFQSTPEEGTRFQFHLPHTLPESGQHGHA